MCQFCGSPNSSDVLINGKPSCGDCSMAIWLTGRDPLNQSDPIIQKKNGGRMGKWVTRAMLVMLLKWVYQYRKESLEHYEKMEKLFGYDEGMEKIFGHDER